MGQAVETEDFPIADFKWLKARRIKYGSGAVWEAVARTTKKGDIDGVACLPLVHTEGKELEVLLVSQFRPPLARRCVELPAGLSDVGESPLDTALRELKEETGYAATCHGTSPVIAGEAGLTDNTLRVVRMHVDGAAAENQSPQPRLDREEEVLKLRTHMLPLRGLQQALDRLALKEDYAIDSRLYAFALGIAMGDEQPEADCGPVSKGQDAAKRSAQPASGTSSSDAAQSASSRGLGKGQPKRTHGQSSAQPARKQEGDAAVPDADLDRNTVGVLMQEIDNTVVDCIGEAFQDAFGTRSGIAVWAGIASALAVSGFMLGRVVASRSQQ